MQVTSAIFDAMGYNTMLVSSRYTESSIILVEIEGAWYNVRYTEFTKLDLEELLSNNKVEVQPTYGPFY